jgi:predicted ATPase
MIKSIQFYNFFSFADETLQLHPQLNVLLGINGSGKTNFIKALKLLKAAAAGRLRELVIDEWGGYDAMAFSGSKEGNKIKLTFELDTQLLNASQGFHFTQSVHYTIMLHAASDRLNFHIEESLLQYDAARKNPFVYFNVKYGKGIVHTVKSTNKDLLFSTSKQKKGLEKLAITDEDLNESVFSKFKDEYSYKEIATVRKAIERLYIYESLDLSPHSKMRMPVMASAATVLKEDGSNLAQVLNTLKNNYRVVYQKISTALQAINPAFEEISFNLLGGNMELMLGEQGLNRAIHARHISDGTLKFLCVLCLLHNPALHNSVLVIDELENALHPDMQHYLMAELHQQAHAQYIVATHSPLLVDGAQPQQLRIVEKDEQNASRIKIPSPATDDWLENYTTGRLWLAGHLGGTRY